MNVITPNLLSLPRCQTLASLFAFFLSPQVLQAEPDMEGHMCS